MPKVLLLSLSVLLLLLSSGSSLSAAQEQKTTENKIDTIKFNGSDYYFRWSSRSVRIHACWTGGFKLLDGDAITAGLSQNN